MAHYSGGNKCAGLALRRLLYSPRMEFAMEAHSGLSAKVASEVGFKALWASGLSVSASFGLRDRNEASWTQVTGVAKQIVEASSGVPVLVDGDTGYGDFNSARILVQTLEKFGVAGVSLEDKLFPKTNSFLDGVGGATQTLADVEEFCLKIRACKEAQANPHFNVVARVEALIAGAGMDEALYRAEEYRKAGADAILIHSRQKEPSEIMEFCRIWDRRIPVVIVPTTYGVGVSKDDFYDAGASLSIWANHNMRASVASMRDVSQQLYEAETVLPSVEEKITPVKEIFALMNEDGMAEDEIRYSPAPKSIKVSHQTQRFHGYDYTPNKNISPDVIVDSIVKEGSTFFAGVPDSLLKSFCESISSSTELTNIVAANEGTAIALAAGNYLATSQIPIVYMQNSGLGNAVNPLLSLVHQDVYAVPMIIFVGWRGENMDEPQHMVQGGCMQEMITDMGFESIQLPVTDNMAAAGAIKEARDLAIKNEAPVFVVVRKDTFGQGNVSKKDVSKLQGPFASSGVSRLEAIAAIDEVCPKKDWVRVCTTGKSSRELYDITLEREGPGHLEDMLTVGSMGHTLSIAQGISLGMAQNGSNKKRVVAIDGDGSAIMQMGSLSQAGYLKSKTPLLHIILNNGTHESVGLETTAAADPTTFNLTGIAKECGYESVKIAENLDEMKQFVTKFEQTDAEAIKGPWMLEVRVGVSNPNAPLSRPKETPYQRRVGVMQHIIN